MEQPKRKNPRLKNFDYSTIGSYFITICTEGRRGILCELVGRAESSRPTTISQIVAVLKRLINKEAGSNIFQSSFNDHVIRDEIDYKTKWDYIETNPVKWVEKRNSERKEQI